MLQIPVNFWAILVSGILSMLIGALWYSPVLFQKSWMKLVGKTEESMKQMSTQKMAVTYLTTFVGFLVMAYILAHFVVYTNSKTILGGLQTGWWSWLGFVATTSLINTLYAGRPWKLYIIDTGYFLVSMLGMGMILTLWK